MLGGAERVGIGTRTHTGRAVVVDDPGTAMDIIEVGDVVITRSTSPSWNSILALAGALVTTSGGLVSHAAVIARELYIPAVIGDTTAFDRFSTGTIVTVDPDTATVTEGTPSSEHHNQLDPATHLVDRPCRPHDVDLHRRCVRR